MSATSDTAEPKTHLVAIRVWLAYQSNEPVNTSSLGRLIGDIWSRSKTKARQVLGEEYAGIDESLSEVVIQDASGDRCRFRPTGQYVGRRLARMNGMTVEVSDDGTRFRPLATVSNVEDGERLVNAWLLGAL